MLSRGTELCTVVEQLHSLRMSFQSIGDPYFLDKAERIVFNALPGTLDPSQWHHQYLQQANEINALYNREDRDHIWKSDHGDATGFGELTLLPRLVHLHVHDDHHAFISASSHTCLGRLKFA